MCLNSVSRCHIFRLHEQEGQSIYKTSTLYMLCSSVESSGSCLCLPLYTELSLNPEPFRDVRTTYIWNKDTFCLALSHLQNSKSELRTIMLEGRLAVLLLLWKEDWGSFSLLWPSHYSHKYAYRMYTELIPILYG